MGLWECLVGLCAWNVLAQRRENIFSLVVAVAGKVVAWWWQWLVKLVVTDFVRFRSLMSRKCIAWQRGQEGGRDRETETPRYRSVLAS